MAGQEPGATASQMAMTWWPAEQATKALEESGRMTASVAPRQPGKAVRRVGGCGASVGDDGVDGDAAAAAVGDDERAHVRGNAGEAGLLAGAGDDDFAAAFEVEDADGVGAGVGDVAALAVGGDVDEVGLAVDGDSPGDLVWRGVDDGDGGRCGC